MKMGYNAHVVVFETLATLDKKAFRETFARMADEVCSRLGQQLGTVVTFKTFLNGEYAS